MDFFLLTCILNGQTIDINEKLPKLIAWLSFRQRAMAFLLDVNPFASHGLYMHPFYVMLQINSKGLNGIDSSLERMDEL